MRDPRPPAGQACRAKLAQAKRQWIVVVVGDNVAAELEKLPLPFGVVANFFDGFMALGDAGNFRIPLAACGRVSVSLHHKLLAEQQAAFVVTGFIDGDTATDTSVPVVKPRDALERVVFCDLDEGFRFRALSPARLASQ
ncbi:MAG: hypothetical protein WKF84_19090 [Pyrinomonadaceae bacterium]